MSRWISRLLLLAGVTLVLGCLTGPAQARGELETIRAILAGARDPEQRLEQVPKLVLHGDRGAAILLDWLVEHDPVLHVRVGAARGLGRVRDEHATVLLVRRVTDGGPWALRKTLHASLGRRGDAPARLLAALDDDRRDRAGRALLLRAAGALKDPDSAERLFHYAAHADHALRDAALRALVERRDVGAERTAHLGRMLLEAGDVEHLREILDVLEPALDRTMRPALQRLTSHGEQDIADTARALLTRMPSPAARRPRPEPGGAAEPDDRYAKQDPPERPADPVPPTPPASSRRQDLVVVFDATGSAHELVRRVHARALREIRSLAARGASIRLGVVVYRGGHGRGARRAGLEVLPLTYDLERATEFIREADARGTDDRGAAMAEGLREALDRMSWRWNATRSVQVFADSGCDDVRETLPRLSTHFEADRTRTAIAYFLRTRSKAPPELDRLAHAGGTTRAEMLR